MEQRMRAGGDAGHGEVMLPGTGRRGDAAGAAKRGAVRDAATRTVGDSRHSAESGSDALQCARRGGEQGKAAARWCCFGQTARAQPCRAEQRAAGSEGGIARMQRPELAPAARWE